MLRRAVLMVAALALLGITVTALACGNGDGERDDVEATVRAAADRWNAGDVEGFLALFTDRGLSELFGAPPEAAEEIRAEVELFIGEDPVTIRDVSSIEVSDGTASANVRIQDFNLETIDRFELVKDGDDWKIDGVTPNVEAVSIPDGYTTVEVEMAEFAFVFDPAAVTAGRIAFDVKNIGQQHHELVLIGVPDDFDLEEALESEEEPEGLEFQGRIELAPGESTNMVFVDDVPAGRYVMLCFFPDEDDPEGTPHVFLGMEADFEIE
jgi:uncharacterized cupredoxin-like copper-binding protein